MNYSLLRDIGLTESETKVYLALLYLGSTTSGPLTEKSGVARSKIYEVLERLITKGLVSYIVKQKTKYYQAEDPIKFQDYIDQKEKTLEQQRKAMNELIPQLQLQKQSAKKSSEAQIYEGFKGIITVAEHTYLKLKKGEEFYSWGIPTNQEERYDLYWKRDPLRRAKAGITCKMLFNHGTPRSTLLNRNSYKGSEARYMPPGIETPSWFLNYKDVTAIFLQSKEMVIEIIDKEIADSFKS